MKLFSLLFLALTTMAHAADQELDTICKATAERYAVAVTNIETSQRLTANARLFDNGFAEDASNSRQIWQVKVFQRGSFVTTHMVTTYQSTTGNLLECKVAKIVLDAVD